MANKREQALALRAEILDERQPGPMSGLGDAKQIFRESNRRNKRNREAPPPPEPRAPGGGGGGKPPRTPPAPVIIDRLHKWGRSYVVLSKDHFTGDDPIHNPAYARGEIASSLAEAYDKCVFLMDKMTHADERCVLIIWGGVWEEQLLIDQNRLDVVGYGDPVIANPDASFRPFEINVPATGPVSTFGQVIRGVKFIDRFGSGAGVAQSFQTAQHYPQMLRFQDVEFHSLGAIPFEASGGFLARGCIFNQISSAPATTFIPSVKVTPLAMPKRAFSKFDDCTMIGRMQQNMCAGTSISIDARTAIDTYPPHADLHHTGVAIVNSEMFGTVEVKGWNAFIGRSGIYSDAGNPEEAGGVGLRLYGHANGGADDDEDESPANVTVDQSNVRALRLALCLNENILPNGKVARIRFNQSSHQPDVHGTSTIGIAAVQGGIPAVTEFEISHSFSSTHCESWCVSPPGTDVSPDADGLGLSRTEAENPYPTNFW